MAEYQISNTEHDSCSFSHAAVFWRRLAAFAVILFFIAPSSFSEWHDDGAAYRLEIKPDSPNDKIFLELKGLLFPASFEKGLTVHNEEGKKLPHRFDSKTQMLFLAGASGGRTFFVYFGFDEPRPLDCWKDAELGKIPETRKLRLRLARGRTDDASESEMLADANYQKYLEIKTAEKELFRKEQELVPLRAEYKALTGRKTKIASDKSAAKDLKDKINAEAEAMKKKLDAEKLAVDEMKTAIKNRTAELAVPPEEMKRFRDEERKIEKLFRPEDERIEVRTAGKVFIDQDPLSKHNELAGQFKGRILISKPGIYAFAVNSRNASVLTIDDKFVAGWLFNHEKSDAWEKSGEIYLWPGPHMLSYCWRWRKSKDGPPPYAAAAWKKPGEKEFQILDENDFTAASPSSILQCSDKKEEAVPFVRYVVNGHFSLDCGKKADWLVCEAVKPPGREISPLWKVGTETVSRAAQASLAPGRQPEVPVILSFEEKNLPDIRINVPEDILKEYDSRLAEPDIFTRLAAPSFIFDDETLEMNLEIVSRLAAKADVLLKTKPDRDDNVFETDTSWIGLEPRRQTDQYLFGQQFVFKRKIEIQGKCFAREPRRLEFTVEIPPLQIAREAVRFIPLADCPDLKCGPGGVFLDPQGERVVPVLHRPTLAEKRNWSFAISLLNELAATKKILVIADDFGGDDGSFESRLRNALGKNSIALEFAAWEKTDGSPSMAASLAKMRSVLSRTDADQLLLIPSVRDTDRGETSREQLRAMSAIIQTAQTNKSIRKIVLATPYPSIRDNPIENEIVKCVKQDLKRDFGIEQVIDINAFVRGKSDWKNSYRDDPDSPSLYNLFPVHLTDEIARKISE